MDYQTEGKGKKPTNYTCLVSCHQSNKKRRLIQPTFRPVLVYSSKPHTEPSLCHTQSLNKVESKNCSKVISLLDTYIPFCHDSATCLYSLFARGENPFSGDGCFLIRVLKVGGRCKKNRFEAFRDLVLEGITSCCDGGRNLFVKSNGKTGLHF